MQGGSLIDSKLLTRSTVHWNVDPSYMFLHQKMMQANLHLYNECTSERIGMLKQHRLERYLPWLFATHEYLTELISLSSHLKKLNIRKRKKK